MSNITCPNCDQANTPGSKFCNYCGHRLPPSDTIICPTCQTPNPASLFYCDNCGSRLIKTNLPSEVEPESGSDDHDPQALARPSDLFSLPARKPGDTGKLDANTVPDWLRTGQREGEQGAPENTPTPDPFEASDESAPARGNTDELPDWLVTDSSADFFQPPSEITTEAYLQMMDDDPLDTGEGPDINEDLNLPDWLNDVVSDTGTLSEKTPPTTTANESEPPFDPFRTASNLPDWLAEMGGAAPREESAAAEEEEIPTVDNWNLSQSDFDESPDWLLDGSEPDTAVSETVADSKADEDFEQSPDWLLAASDEDAAKFEESAVAVVAEQDEPEPVKRPQWQMFEETDDALLPSSALREWGTAVAPGVDLPTWYDELERPDQTEYDNFLSKIDELPEPEFVIDEPEPEEVSMSDRLSEWFTESDEMDLAEEDETYEEEEVERKVVTGMLTGWLADLDEEEEDEEQEEERKAVTGMLTGWLTDLDETEADEFDEAETAETEPRAGEFTNWLTDSDADETETADAAPATFLPEADSLTDWLAEEAELEDESELDRFNSWLTNDDEDTVADVPESQLLTGWLTSTDESEEADFVEDQPHTSMLTNWLSEADDVEEENFPEEDLAEEDVAPGMFTGWLTDGDEADGEDPEEAGLETGTFTNWLADAGETTEDLLEEDESDDLGPRFTGWLEDADAESEDSDQPEAAFETGQFTSWLTDSEADLEADALEEDEPDADRFTHWLSDTEEAEGAPEADEEPESGLFTNWLADADEADEFVDNDVDGFADEETSDDPLDKFATGMLTGWLSDLEEEADDDAEDEETKVVTGMLTGWLSDLDESEAEEDEASESELFADWLAESDDVDEEETEISFAALAPTLAEDDEDLWLQPEIDEAEETADEMALPDWFEALDDASTSDSMAAEGYTGELFTDEEPLGDLDWLGPATGELLDEEEAVIETADAAPASTDEWASWHDDEDLDEEPDWMSELNTLETSDFTPQSETSEFGRRFAELVDYPASEAELPAPQEADKDESEALDLEFDGSDTDFPLSELDDRDDDFPLSEEEAREAFPDWLSDLGDASTKDPENESELVQADLPQWLSNMKPSQKDTEGSSLPGLGLDSLADDFAEIPEELSGADLPDWLQGIPSSRRNDRDASDTEFSSDIPDWLRGDGEPLPEKDPSNKLRSILSELPPPRDPKEELVKAEIPEWIDALKPKDLGGTKSTEPAGPAPKSGPLLGVKGAIEIAPIIAAAHMAQQRAVNELSVTPDQQQQATLLQQLAEGEMMLMGSAVSPRQRIAWGRILTSIILLLVMSAVILLDMDLPLVREAQGAAPEAVAAINTALADVAGETVLVAFDYTPALAGELDTQAEALMAQLAENGSPVIAVSQYAAGTAIAEAYSDEPALFIPGEAIGLRQLSSCLTDGCDTLYGRSLETELADVSLIIILTGERKSLINWMEQVQPQAHVPVLAGTTQALEPVALSYVDSRQLTGILSYAAATGQYEDVMPATAGEQRLITAQIVIQLLLVIVLLFTLITQILRSRSKTS